MEHAKTPLTTNSTERIFRIRIPGTVVFIVKEIFTAFLVTYLVFYIIDMLADSFISKQFDMNVLLWTVVVSGVLTIFLQPKQDVRVPVRSGQQVTMTSVVAIIGIGLVAAGLVYLNTKALGRLGIFIAAISGVLVILLSFVMLFDDSVRSDSEKD